MIRKYAEIFLLKKCECKSYSHFFSKNIRILCFESAKTVNEMTLNELVKLTTLRTTGPCLLNIHDIWAWYCFIYFTNSYTVYVYQMLYFYKFVTVDYYIAKSAPKTTWMLLMVYNIVHTINITPRYRIFPMSALGTTVTCHRHSLHA